MYTPDPFIIVSEGMVQNDPSLPTYDFDCLDESSPTGDTLDEVERLAQRLQTHLLDADAGLTSGQRRLLEDGRDDCKRWLANHMHLADS